MRCTLVVVAVVLTLAGCRESVQDPEEVRRLQSAGNGGGELHFSYPLDGQKAVAVTSPLLLRFSDGIETPVEDLGDSVMLRTGQGERVPLEAFRLVGDGQGVRAERKRQRIDTYSLT